MTTAKNPDLLPEIKERIFNPYSLEISNIRTEQESAEYNACLLQINSLNVLFRTAKITPTKTGQFVTLWKRIRKGPIQPYDLTDTIDLFIINVKTENQFGQFVFPKVALCQQNVLTTALKEGKRAIRVYPPWNITTSKQAQKTQQWQLEYFLEIPMDKAVDEERVKELYFIK